MATTLESLEAARSGAAAKLAEALTGDYSKAIEFKPNFNAANGVDRVTYLRELRETIAFLDSEISKHGAWEFTSEMSS